MFRLIAIGVLTLAGLLNSCTSPDAQVEREWQEQLRKNIATVGARNWIVVAESSYPAYTGNGIRTMVSQKKSEDVLPQVLNILEEQAHVSPRIMMSSELRNVPEDYAPGITKYRKSIAKLLPGRQHFELMSHVINSLIRDAAQQFNVLVIKTQTALPYSNIYIELDSGYWNAESEAALRQLIEPKQVVTPELQQLKPDADLPAIPETSQLPVLPQHNVLPTSSALQ